MDGDCERPVHKRQNLKCVFGLLTSVSFTNQSIYNFGLSVLLEAIAFLIIEASYVHWFSLIKGGDVLVYASCVASPVAHIECVVLFDAGRETLNTWPYFH